MSVGTGARAPSLPAVSAGDNREKGMNDISGMGLHRVAPHVCASCCPVLASPWTGISTTDCHSQG